MHAELIEDDGESRYKVTDIIGEWLEIVFPLYMAMQFWWNQLKESGFFC